MRDEDLDLSEIPEVTAEQMARARLRVSRRPASNADLFASPRFQALLAQSRRSIQEGKGLSEEDFWVAIEERHAGRAEDVPSE